ncbi:MAG: GNAT family N-acetyltransferase [Arachnia sp.]
MSLVIRPHLASDAAASLSVFKSAIRTTAAADYSTEQIRAWASPDIDVDGWSARRMAGTTVVAVIDDVVIGFTDVDIDGYIDMMFVHPDHGRRGVASALLAWTVAEASRLGASTLHTHASITARPFFEALGFTVTRKSYPMIRGVTLENHDMSRPV